MTPDPLFAEEFLFALWGAFAPERARRMTPLQRAMGRLEFEDRIALARFARLRPEEQGLLRTRYGMGGNPPLSREEMARSLRRARETVRRNEQRALAAVWYGDQPGALPLDQVWSRVSGLEEPEAGHEDLGMILSQTDAC